MHLTFRNVHEAFQGTVHSINTGVIKTDTYPSRVGEVLKIPEPLIVTYQKPWECVLFNRARDANPFFHLYEALWMLAGRNDLEPLLYYNSTFGNFSDDGKTLHGAYGYRWRNFFGYDQLDKIVEELRGNPYSRRCVLQMWNAMNVEFAEDAPIDDLFMATHGGKDVPCNLSCTFDAEIGDCIECKGTGVDVHDNKCPKCKGYSHEQTRYLNMTVFNRSNDILWGTYGANAVHFAFLLEYLSARIGLESGSYHQISSNAHFYSERYEPEKWLEDREPNWYLTLRADDTIPLVRNPETFDKEVKEFIEAPYSASYEEPFLRKVASPMCRAFYLHKKRSYLDAFNTLETVVAKDWRIAGKNWIDKREQLYEKRSDPDYV